MDGLNYLFRLVDQAAGGLSYVWQVSATLLVSMALTLMLAVIRQRQELRAKLRYLPLPLIGTTTILLAGSFLEGIPSLISMVHIGAGLTLLLTGITVRMTKGIRPLSVSTSLLVLWFSFWCWFVSAMSISGDWM